MSSSATRICSRCGQEIYGEETVIRLQQQAVYAHHNLPEAERIEQKSGYRCTRCGATYCKQCLERYAPPNSMGGKSCPRCGWIFEILHDE